MSRFCLIPLCIGFVVVTLGPVSAFLKDNSDFHASVRPVVLKCLDEYGVSEDEFKATKQPGMADDIDPCFLACLFKGNGMLDDEGMFAKETALEKIKKFIKDENVLKEIEELGNTCSSVNDEEVTDGDKGCERAHLLHKCFMENKGAL